MTCVIGLKDKKNKRLYIGSDSAGIDTNNLSLAKFPFKIFEIYSAEFDSKMLVGCSGSIRSAQTIQFALNLPYHQKTKSDYDYICTDVMFMISDLLEETKSASIEMNQVRIDGGMIIAYKDNLYTIRSDLAVFPFVHDYDAIGCGDQVALGSLYSTDGLLDTEDRVKLSLDASAEFSAGVSGPFNIDYLEYEDEEINDEKEYEVIDER